MNTINLKALGLSEAMLEEYNKKYDRGYLGRVIEEQKNLYKIMTEAGKVLGKISGKMDYLANNRLDYPTVGDWVILDRTDDDHGEAVIAGILTRKSKFSRKISGNKSDEQIIAANVDTLFLTMALNHDFNLKRMERYISLAWDSGATPVILLTKADLCEDIEGKYDATMAIAPGIDVIAVSIIDGRGLDDVQAYIKMGKTVSFVGSSGVGKSSLINDILGKEKQAIKEIGHKGRGKHTTTYRELIPIPGGGVMIDTPGMREIGLLDNTEGVDGAFDDIESLARRCKFSDCSHESEPGCAIKEALSNGKLSDDRFSNYLKLKNEVAFMARKMNIKAQRSYVRELNKKHRSQRKTKY